MPTFVRDGVALYHELHGDPSSPALVLLEGMGGETAGWRRNIPALAERFRVVAHDFRGNGRSKMTDEPVTMHTFVDDTIALMDHLGIERAHVYGMSFGGFVAQILALDHPGRVLRLVLGATHFGGPGVVRSRTPVPKGQPFRALYAPGFPESNPDHVAADLFAGAPTRQRPHARRRQAQAARAFDVSARVGQLAPPTLVIHGTADQLIPVENARRLAAAIPGARLCLLEGAGHVYHSEQPDAADAAVIGFLSGDAP